MHAKNIETKQTKRMSTFYNTDFDKYRTSVKTKFTRKPLSFVIRVTCLNIETMQTKRMLKFNDNDFDKCETCVKSKFRKKAFPSVKRVPSLLDLI